MKFEFMLCTSIAKCDISVCFVLNTLAVIFISVIKFFPGILVFQVHLVMSKFYV